MTPNTDAPDYDSPNAADNDSAYHHSWSNCKNKKYNMTPNTDVPNYDSPSSSDDNDDSPDSLILDVKLTPSQCLKYKNITVTDSDTATNDASPGVINTSPHAPNSATEK